MPKHWGPAKATWVVLVAALMHGVLAACGDDSLPEGQEDVAAMCSSWRAVSAEFPFDVPPDVSNPGQNLRAWDAIEQAGFEVAAMHDAVRISSDSQAVRAFERYANEIEGALDDAEDGTSGLDTPSEWLDYQEELNQRAATAERELEEDLAALGVDLQAECAR